MVLTIHHEWSSKLRRLGLVFNKGRFLYLSNFMRQKMIEVLTNSSLPSLQTLVINGASLVTVDWGAFQDVLMTVWKSVTNLCINFSNQPGVRDLLDDLRFATLVRFLRPFNSLVDLTFAAGSANAFGLPAKMSRILLLFFLNEQRNVIPLLECLHFGVDAHEVLRQCISVKALVLACHLAPRHNSFPFALQVDVQTSSKTYDVEAVHHVEELLADDKDIKACSDATSKIRSDTIEVRLI